MFLIVELRREKGSEKFWFSFIPTKCIHVNNCSGLLVIF